MKQPKSVEKVVRVRSRGIAVKTHVKVGPTEELYGNYNFRPPPPNFTK